MSMSESFETLADVLRDARRLMVHVGGLQPPGQTTVSAEDWEELQKLIRQAAALAEWFVVRPRD